MQKKYTGFIHLYETVPAHLQSDVRQSHLAGAVGTRGTPARDKHAAGTQRARAHDARRQSEVLAIY